jgi:phosphate/sulfate permease
MVTPLEQKAIEELANQAIPEIVNVFQPLIDTIKPIMGFVSAVVGGLFGLYLIFIISRLYYERKKVKLLKNINYNLDYLNQHFNLPYSNEKRTPKRIMPLEKWREAVKERKNKMNEKQAKKEKKQQEKLKRKIAKKKLKKKR